MKDSEQGKACSLSDMNVDTRSLAHSQADVLYEVDRPSGHDSQERSPGGSQGSSAHSSTQHDKNEAYAPSIKKLHQFASRTKKATKRLLNVPDQQNKRQDESFDNDQSLPILEDDAAFNVRQLNTKHRSEKGVTARIQVNLRAVAAGIMHPKQGIKGKATRSTAGQLSRMERPYLSKTMDIEFLEAHNNLSHAQSLASSMQDASEEESDTWGDTCKDKVERLESQRESLRAAYTTSRLVHRVRVVPKRHINCPGTEDHAFRDSQGKYMAYGWLKWVGHNLLFYTQDFSAQYIDDFDELPFDIDSVRQQLERLAIASAPWQTFFMDLRSVYCWDHPFTTTKWLALYIFLWYTQHLIGFLYAYVIYIVARNRYFPSSVEVLRESIRRSHDQRSGAYKFGELVDKHGRHHWIEPLLDELGPYVQLQLNDLANMLEVFVNFHAWAYPRKTAATLIFLAVCFLLTVLTDMAFCVKITTFVIGGAFFCCWPIACKYPKYRYLVSPLKWAFWDIPTDAEWSFQYLRRHAQTTREQLIENKVDRIHQEESDCGSLASCITPEITVNEDISYGEDDLHSVYSTARVLDGMDIVAYRAYSQGAVGRLIVYTGGIRFVQSIKRREIWRVSYLELAEMRKKEGPSLLKIPGVPSQSLEFKFINGSKIAVEGMKDRDSAFNTIIGFSGLQWQSLQAKTIKEGGDDGI